MFLQDIIMITFIINTLSCMNNKSNYTIDVSEEYNEAKFNKIKNELDAQFLV